MKKINIGIRMKIISIMLIVIILPVTIISLISYGSSSRMMTNQYRELGITIGSEISEGIEIKMEDMSNSLRTISSSDRFVFENVEEENPQLLLNDFSNLISTYNVNNVYFIAENGNVLSTDKNGFNESDIDLTDDWYNKTLEQNDEEKVNWSNIKKDKNDSWYVIMSTKVYSGSNLLGVIAVDVPVDVFDNILSDKRIGTSGFPILLDSNSVKLALKDTDEIGVEFKGKENFENMKEDIKAIRNEYIRNGEVQQQFTIINKIKDTDWHMITIVPINNIKESTSEMLKLILIVGLITVLIGIAISIVFSKTIIKPLRDILSSMKKMESGDFSEKIVIKNTDEFGQLRDGFNNMMNTLSQLIMKIKDISEEVSISSETLAAISEETSASGEEISRTSEEIAIGANNQSEELENSSKLINNLSDKLIELSKDSNMIVESVLNVNKTIDNSNVIVENLSSITKSNRDKTLDVSRRIHELDGNINEIDEILNTIDNIAEQTNLLALNAGIEAARAGDAGRGFAVVAEEIRKLAGESKESSSNIQTIIENIQIESNQTVRVMEDVQNESNKQDDIVKNVDNAFRDLSRVIENVNRNITQVGRYIEDINGDKDYVVSSIDNILAVSEETAAASEEVSASIEQQSKATIEVAEAAENLNELSRQLNDEMIKFKS